MSNCHDIQNELSAFIDGELAVARRAEVEAHLTTCAACRQRADQLRQLAAGVNALPELPASPRFLAEVRAKIDGREKRSWFDALFQPFWLKVPLEALALVAVLVTTTVLLRPPPAPPASQVKAEPEEHTWERLALGRGLADRRDAPASVAQPAAPAEKPLDDRSTKTALEKQPETAAALTASRSSGITPPRQPAPVLDSAGGGAIRGVHVEELSRHGETELALGERDKSGADRLGAWGVNGTSGPTASAAPAPVEAITISGDAAQVRQQAELTASQLGGRLVVHDEKRDLYVELPAQNVAEFKKRLGEKNEQLALRYFDTADKDKESAASNGQVTTDGDGVNQLWTAGAWANTNVSLLPRVVLQIQIAPTNAAGSGGAGLLAPAEPK